MGIDDNNSSSSSTNHIVITMEEEDALEIGCKPDCSTNNDVEINNDKPERFFYIFFSFFLWVVFYICLFSFAIPSAKCKRLWEISEKGWRMELLIAYRYLSIVQRRPLL